MLIRRRYLVLHPVSNAGSGVYYRTGMGSADISSITSTITSANTPTPAPPRVPTLAENIVTNVLGQGGKPKPPGVTVDQASAPNSGMSTFAKVAIVGGVGLGAFLLYKKMKG